jgi:hypothetical protein
MTQAPDDTRKRIVIVGNGPVEAGLAERIDSADIVIRFNEPGGLPGRVGTRTDILFLMNSGKSMQERLASPAYWQSTLVRNAREIILPYHPSIIKEFHPRPNLLSRLKGRKADWTAETLQKIEALGKTAKVLPAEFYFETCRILGIARTHLKSVFPSSGLLAIRYAIEEFKSDTWTIEFCGFSWEGWKRHAWGSEQEWVAEQIAQGKVAPLR